MDEYHVQRASDLLVLKPRCWNMICKLMIVFIVEKRSECRDFNARILRFDSHG